MDKWHPDMPAEYKNKIVTGDARELVKRIPDESIYIIHTDPPYEKEYEYTWYDLGEYAARVLVPGGSLIAVVGHYQVPMAINALTAHGLRYHWIGWLNHVQKSTSMAFRTVRGGKPFLWISKGKPTIKHGFFWDTKVGGGADKRYHKWGQQIDYVVRDLAVLTVEEDIVLEPFCGGGTVPAACKMMRRNYVAFEIDPSTAERARERVRNTQPPLFIMPYIQADMFEQQ